MSSETTTSTSRVSDERLAALLEQQKQSFFHVSNLPQHLEATAILEELIERRAAPSVEDGTPLQRAHELYGSILTRVDARDQSGAWVTWRKCVMEDVGALRDMAARPSTSPVSPFADDTETLAAKLENERRFVRHLEERIQERDRLIESLRSAPVPSLEEQPPQTVQLYGEDYVEVPNWTPQDAVDGTHLQYGERGYINVAALRSDERKGFVGAAVMFDAKLFKPVPTPEEFQQPASRRIHELKTWPSVFWDLKNGSKKAEFRCDDRDYRIGDVLRLKEWFPEEKTYSGHECEVEVTHVVKGGQFGIPEGYAMMSVAVVTREEQAS